MVIVAGVYATTLAGEIVGAPSGNVKPLANNEYTLVTPPSPTAPEVRIYRLVPALTIVADEFNFRLLAPILNNLSLEKVRTPFIVVLASRDTGATTAVLLFNSMLLKIPFPSIV